MRDKVLLATVLSTTLFLTTGILLLSFSLSFSHALHHAPNSGRQATRHLLFQRFPLRAALANAVLVLASSALAVPGLLSSRLRPLRAAGAAVAVCLCFTLVLGLSVWMGTLRVGEELEGVYAGLDASRQSLIQTDFKCCGYANTTTFVTDEVCPSPAVAALSRGCKSFISTYANNYVDVIFTALFGMVAVDALLLLSIACLVKSRKERERYRLIEEKTGYGHF